MKEVRYRSTLAFLKKHIGENKSLLDLGVPNPLSKRMQEEGYRVRNTSGENLDYDYGPYLDPKVDCITSFEIFEHMLAPFNILRAIRCDQLVASVPLNLWFATAYWNPTEVWDRHYHEFEPRQFDMLLDRSGWEIQASEKWTSVDLKNFGVRPILRRFTKRYYIVHCTRKKGYVYPV